MPLILDLEAAYRDAQGRPRLCQAELNDLHTHYVGRPVAALSRRTAERRIWRGADLFQARGPQPHRRRTRSTTASDRSCWPGAWARRASSPRPAPASTASPRRRCAPASAFPAPCSWAPPTSSARRRTSCACSMLGAEVRPVTAGAGTLKDAMNEALRDWVTNVETTYYLIGTAAGPHPYPEMVRDFQSVIGTEIAPADDRADGPAARCASSPASAAAPTPSAPSTPSSTTPRSPSTAPRPAATASRSRTATPPR